jgi:hypothetical protein
VSTGLYFYAVSRGLTADDVAGLTGVEDAPVRLVEQAGLVALVSEVDLEEFGEEGLRRNLEDLRWLEAVAVAHDRVARHAAERVPTAPLRLATVFLGEESLRAQMAEWHESAERTLDRIEGRSEWSVKAYVDPAADGSSEQEPAGNEGMGAGRAYLLKRRAATQRREQAAQAAADVAEEIHAELAGSCIASRRLAAQDRRLSGHTGEMVLNGTYLVDQSQTAEFKEAVDRLAARHAHVRLEVGGPWPPYSFASLDTT